MLVWTPARRPSPGTSSTTTDTGYRDRPSVVTSARLGWSPRAQEATEVVLHPLRGLPAERDLAVGLHSLPAHPPRRPTRHRCRDHQLARRLHPLRPARGRPPSDHHPDRGHHVPRSPCPARDPGLHAHRHSIWVRGIRADSSAGGEDRCRPAPARHCCLTEWSAQRLLAS